MRTKFSHVKRFRWPPSPTAQQVKKLLRDYAIKQWEAARICGVADGTVARYLSGESVMPPHRWATLLRIVRQTVHPDREIEL
jgi:hypothetical protein